MKRLWVCIALLWGQGVIFSPLWAASQEAGDRTAGYSFLVVRNYPALESYLGEQLKKYKADPASFEELQDALLGLVRYADEGQESLFTEWVGKSPKSYLARVARGYYYSDRAWKMRGGAYANDTTTQQFEGFARYMGKAEADLLASTKLDDKPMLSYVELIRVAMGLGNGQARAMFEQAVRLDPTSCKARLQYLVSAIPKWGGSVPQMELVMAETEASTMSEADKNRVRARYYFWLADDAQLKDRAEDAIALFWRSYEIGVDKSSDALKRATKLALKARLFDKALKLLDEQLRIDLNTNWARNNRGYINEIQLKRLDRAFEDYQKSAAAGDTWAQYRLGYWYATGTFVAKDVALAKIYLKQAAAKGNKSAAYHLQRMERGSDQPLKAADPKSAEASAAIPE